jgi:hypothetical protein
MRLQKSSIKMQRIVILAIWVLVMSNPLGKSFDEHFRIVTTFYIWALCMEFTSHSEKILWKLSPYLLCIVLVFFYSWFITSIDMTTEDLVLKMLMVRLSIVPWQFLNFDNGEIKKIRYFDIYILSALIMIEILVIHVR